MRKSILKEHQPLHHRSIKAIKCTGHDGEFAINPQFEWAGGGFAGTPRNLARWAADIYEGRAYDSTLLEEALDGVPARLGPGIAYGLGVIIWPMRAGTAWGHSGFFPGYLTEMRYFPEHLFAIAWQVNTSVQRNLGSSPIALIDDLALDDAYTCHRKSDFVRRNWILLRCGVFKM